MNGFTLNRRKVNKWTEGGFSDWQEKMEEPGNVYITNLNGKPVTAYHISDAHDQKVLDTREWKAGIYIAALKINGKMIESVKFSITN